MNTDEKAMLESTTALVWEHQRDIQELSKKVGEMYAGMQNGNMNSDLYGSLCRQLEDVWNQIHALGRSIQSLSCQVDSLAVKELL